MTHIESIKQHMRQAGANKWLDSLLPGLEQSRAELTHERPSELAWRSGCQYDAGAQQLVIPFWGQAYRLNFPELLARDERGQAASPDRQALLLMYLKRADGAGLDGKWLAYRELPGGLFYAQAFAGYAERRLAQAFGEELNAFIRAARAMDGVHLSLGSAAFEFAPLPRVRLAAVYWLGDEDFPPNASILFDSAAPRYLSLDALAMLGSQLTSRLIRAKKSELLDKEENLTGLERQ
ncbi:MAG: DUF3786 domain-containing protein [Thermoflexales bacterium]|nr:DUF3786 domain-containing protein [Thermoflexales bacterium]